MHLYPLAAWNGLFYVETFIEKLSKVVNPFLWQAKCRQILCQKSQKGQNFLFSLECAWRYMDFESISKALIFGHWFLPIHVQHHFQFKIYYLFGITLVWYKYEHIQTWHAWNYFKLDQQCMHYTNMVY